MKSIILCEGGTDLTLIQYYMEKSCGWYYKSNGTLNNFKLRKYLLSENTDDELYIASCDGVTKIPEKFDEILESNEISDEGAFDTIVIITDRDEYKTVSDFDIRMKESLNRYNITCTEEIENNTWMEMKYRNGLQEEQALRVLLLVIPFEDCGALETFLLNALAAKDSTDQKLINQCNNFVDHVDSDGKYLTHRRHIIKAKFDVYFSIRTPLDQFTERRNILRGIKWEEYTAIQETFLELKRLKIEHE